MTSLVDEHRAMDRVYLDPSKAFDIVFYDIVMEKVTSICGEVTSEVYPELSEWSSTGPQGGNQWRKGRLEEGVNSVPQGSVLELLLLNMFIRVLDCGAEFTLTKFADNIDALGRLT